MGSLAFHLLKPIWSRTMITVKLILKCYLLKMLCHSLTGPKEKTSEVRQSSALVCSTKDAICEKFLGFQGMTP